MNFLYCRTFTKHRKRIALFLLANFASQLVAPPLVWALTSGPGQPEFSGFEPVGVPDSVNKFTGDFTYDIPVIEVPGPQGESYPLTLSYHSGANAEEEASWVGYGWNLSPGAINRNMRGLPDDYYDEDITYWNKVPRNFTVTAGLNSSLELFSGNYLSGSFKSDIAGRYNNYSGFGYNVGIGISLNKGLVSLGVSESESGHRSYSASVNPMAALSFFSNRTKDDSKGQTKPAETENTNRHSHTGQLVAKVGRALAAKALAVLTQASNMRLLGGNHGMLDYDEVNRPSAVTSYTGKSYNITTGLEINPAPLPVGPTVNISGSYTYQDSRPQDKLAGYGYMYSDQAVEQKNNSSSVNAANTISDYYTEKDAPYNKRDVFLGAALGNADNYNVSANGIGGGFQLHHSQAGDFGPNRKSSRLSIYNYGLDLDVGGAFGIGANGSVGEQTLEEASWDELLGKPLNTFSSISKGQGTFFRFTNDLGGSVGSAAALASDDAVTAGLIGEGSGYKLDKTGSLGSAIAASAQRNRQASHIGHHSVLDAETLLRRYCKRADIDALRYRPLSARNAVQNKAIAEFKVTNEQGQQYTYGLPLYTAQEKSFQFGLQGTASNKILNNMLAFTDVSAAPIKVGEERPGAYATSYLLTEIASSDYVDRNLNGPDDQDFGSYTAFSYTKLYGGRGAAANGWYHWRMPFTGYQYQQNSLSDVGDDMGVVSEGDKEIAYLQAVHTPTHTAIFTISSRDDGYDASSTAGVDSTSALGTHQLQKLDKIELYNNSDVTQGANGQWQATGKPIKTVTFAYDYQLCQQTPNSKVTAANPNRGRLTLTSVTTAYYGTVTAKPYRFSYVYPFAAAPTQYPLRYRSLTSGISDLTAGYQNLVENPFYRQSSIDAWGGYQNPADGKIRYNNLQFWPNQQAPVSSYDPAAWQLKVIQLPSGGEVHVQYEQDDYAYVQDKPAQVLMGLASASADDTFVLDPASVGLTSTNLPACKDLIQEYYINQGNKIYFKFLYQLINNGTAALPQVQEAGINRDYITGYVSVRQVDIINGQLVLKVGDGSSVNNLDGDAYTLPRQVCMDFVRTQRLGKLGKNGLPMAQGVDTNEPDAFQLMRQFYGWSKTIIRDLPTINSSLCAKLNPAYSYFKVPLPTSKRGGGLRVKRLLTYTQSLDGAPQLYGNEYEYKAYDPLVHAWRSSGVATTEPSAMRDENSLVYYIPRLKQSSFSRVIAGIDRKQSEGPIGESLLPAASVGYSRVTVKNIQSGKTNPGYSISEYYTCRDAPAQWKMTSVANRSKYLPIFTGLYNTVDNNTWSTQGFSFILNNMHGQPKREAVYSGPYDDINQQLYANLVSETRHEFYAPGESVLVQDEPEAAPIANTYPGKEVDVTMAQRAIRDHTIDKSLEFDNQIAFILFGIPFPTISFSYSKFSSENYTHTTSKVVRYPAIEKRVISFHDGVRDTMENRVLDRYTGHPVAVTTSDMGRGGYWKQDVMASWVYPQSQGKALNEGLVFSGLSTGTSPVRLNVASGTGSYLSLPASSACLDLLHSVRSGDVLALQDATAPGTYYYYHAAKPDMASRQIKLYPYLPTAVAAATATIAEATIVFSGNNNELQTKVGSTTYYGPSLKRLSLSMLAKFAPQVNGKPADPLARDMQARIVALTSPSALGTTLPAQQSFLLPGIYHDINVSGFADHLPTNTPVPCRNAMSKMDISDLQFVLYQQPGGNDVRVQLVSFKIICNGSTYSVQ